jgi:hypothetical protein
MSSLGSFKIEYHEITFTPAGGDVQTIVFSNTYSSPPKVTATCLSENMSVYVADINATQVIISTSGNPTVDIKTHVHVIGN